MGSYQRHRGGGEVIQRRPGVTTGVVGNLDPSLSVRRYRERKTFRRLNSGTPTEILNI